MGRAMLREYRQLKLSALIFSSSVVLFSPVYLVFPEYRRLIAGEDHVIETITAIAFLSCFIYGIVAFAARWPISSPIILAVLSIVGLMGFLDELSFGERFFDLRMPTIGTVKIDGAHDFVYLFYNVYGILAVLAVIAAAALSISIGWLYRDMLKLERIGVSRETGLLFGVFVLLLGVSLFLDLELLPHGVGFYFVEEMLEMNAGIVLLLCCRSLTAKRARHALPSRHIGPTDRYSPGRGGRAPA
jgi:hypothetical protein